MTVVRVSKYETPDGKLHDSMEDAYKHESARKAKASIMAAIEKATGSNGQTSINPGNFTLDLLNDPSKAELMRAAMNRVLDYHRRHGKLKKSA